MALSTRSQQRLLAPALQLLAHYAPKPQGSAAVLVSGQGSSVTDCANSASTACVSVGFRHLCSQPSGAVALACAEALSAPTAGFPSPWWRHPSGPASVHSTWPQPMHWAGASLQYSSRAEPRGHVSGVVPPDAGQRSQQAAKQQAAKPKDTSKELQLRVRIMEHDLATKLRKAEAWLADGLSVSLVVLYRGDEQVEPAAQLCDSVVSRLEGKGKPLKPRRQEGGAWRVMLRPPPPPKGGAPQQQQPK